MVIEDIGGYAFGRGQMFGKFLNGPLAGREFYLGDVEVERSFTAGEEFERFSATSGDRLKVFSDVDGNEIGGTITFFQWNEVARDLAAMAHKTPADQAAATNLTKTAKAHVRDRILLGKYAVSNVVVSSDDGNIIWEEGDHYHVSNNGKTPAVITILALPDDVDAGDDVTVDFGCAAKKLSARPLLNQSKFEMELTFMERMKADNDTAPATTVLRKCNVMLEGNMTLASPNAELKNVTATFTSLADANHPEQPYGYIMYPEAA